MSDNLDNYTVEELQNEINKRNMKVASWYEFDQDNSGGYFVENDKVTHRVFIQALSLEDCITKAEALGIYFNGCDSGRDCDCCGDRWYKPYSELKFPIDWSKGISFNNIEEYAQYLADKYAWYNIKVEAYLYYLDGTKKEILSDKTRVA